MMRELALEFLRLRFAGLSEMPGGEESECLIVPPITGA